MQKESGKKQETERELPLRLGGERMPRLAEKAPRASRPQLQHLQSSLLTPSKQPSFIKNKGQSRAEMAQSLESRPTVVDFREDSPWSKLAKAHWLDVKVRKVKPEVIKQQLWDPLEEDGFTNRSLLTLENLNVLEKYGCPRA